MMNEKSRGLRANNPGNIRISPVEFKGEVDSKDPEFKSFESMEWGYRAIFMLLYTYQKRYELNTIREFINRYAPPCENHTDKYIDFVSHRAGILPDQILDTKISSQMVPIVAAMSKIECGVSPSIEQIEKGWELFIN